jgi:hypothetical protein
MGTTTRRSRRGLPGLPESVGELGPETRVTTELAGWLVAMQTLADQGDARAGKALIEAYDKVPRLWERLTGLQENAERSWVDLTAPDRPGQEFTRTAIRRELDRRRREISGATPSPLERLLVDRVVLCWLQAAYADAHHAQRLAAPGGISFRESEYLQRRSERAQRQLLRAVQTLATVRRLLTPTVQVNIAEKQINLAG